ncbi:FAD-binding oxidoreductase [Fodinibius sediminis]|uniref:Ferredoxin--NADP+ reductase n=1 Tax=Fodinibius sediminis TaxID=1214077 RepID=A0A521BVY6_9BACT|nr:FAD-binding oxidoreductase [Fodinibius sediminis]SMO51352.1 ferredoxin--NADP+ reductase [Fodinibius sediminis]
MSEIKLPEVELNIYTPREPVEAVIVENRICTKESSPNFVRHVTFDISGTELEGHVQVGQSIGILPPGEDENGRPHKLRLYSVSSPTKGEDGQAHLVSTTVKRTIEEFDNNELYLGVCSNYLADLQPGDKVKMTGPSGRRFLLPENATDFNYVMFATGTGIAPYRGMIKEMIEAGIENDIVLVFGCPYRTDLLYADYFEPLAEEYDNFHYLPHISREARRADGTKKYVQTCLWDAAELMDPLLEKENTLLYICGLKGMEAGIYQALGQKKLNEYLDIREPAAGKKPEDWDEKDLKRYVKPSPRTFVEVY